MTFAAGWAYLDVAQKPGHRIEVEYHDGQDWLRPGTQGYHHLIPMYEWDTDGTSWRARYTRARDASAWTTGTVAYPDYFHIDPASGGQAGKPEAPQRISANPIGGSQVGISWLDTSDNPDGWLLQWRRTSAHTPETRHINRGEVELEAGRRNITLRDLHLNTEYTASVQAVRGNAESDPASVTFHTTGRTDGQWGPADPYNLQTTNVTATSVTLQWQQDDTPAVKYWQAMGRVTGEQRGPANQHPESPTVTFTDLEPGTGYDFMVAARGWDLTYSGWARVQVRTLQEDERPEAGRPARPSGVAWEPGDTFIRLSWDPADGVDRWVVRYTAPDGAELRQVRTTPDATLRGLSPDTAYQVSVTAVRDDEFGNEAESEPHEVTIRTTGTDRPPSPPPGGKPPQTPRNLRVHCIHPTSAKAEWDQPDPADPVDRWEVSLNVPGVPELETIGTIADLKQLTPGTSYTVSVRAVRGDARSDPATGEFRTGVETPPPDPDEPQGTLPPVTGLYATSPHPNVVEAMWDTAAHHATWWVVTVDGRTWRRVNTNYTRISGITAGTQFEVAVYAVLEGGWGQITDLSPIARSGVTTARKGV